MVKTETSADTQSYEIHNPIKNKNPIKKNILHAITEILPECFIMNLK